MMNFEKSSLYRFQNIRKNVIFGRSGTQIFFQEICSTGGKQTIHKVSAAFIVKNCHPRKSLTLFHTGLFGTFSPEEHPP